MPETRITAEDVARKAGVSQPTVSRVFTPGARVSPDKVKRVREAARELGYQPNTLARSLNTGRSHTIGIVLAWGSRVLRRLQTGYVSQYALAMALGVFVLLCFYMVVGS